MRRNTLNYVVDLLTLFVILGMSWTGLVIRFVLPPGTGGRHGHGEAVWSLWNRTRHEWGDIHTWLAASLGVLLLLHVGLHWTWVCATTKRILTGRDKPGAGPAPKTRHAYGAGAVLLLVILLGGGTWLASTRVEKSGAPSTDAAVRQGRASEAEEGVPAGADDGHGDHGDHDAHWIRGSMTLGEAAEAMEMSVEELGAKLSLPESVSPDERLGRLARRYGFSLQEVRALADRRGTRR